MLTVKHLEYASKAIKFVCGAGVTKIVHDIVKTNVVPNSTYDTVRVWAGTAVISAIAVERSSDHIDHACIKIADWCAKTKAEAEAKKK